MSLHSNAGSHASIHFSVLVSSYFSYNNWAFSEILSGLLHSLRSRLSFWKTAGKIGGTFLPQEGSLECKYPEYKVVHKEEQLFLELE